MSDLISKQCDDLRWLAESFEEIDSHIADWGGEAKSAAGIIYSAVDTIETLSANRPTGKWIDDGCIEKCSRCGERRKFPHWNYCPNCGADMRGEE